MTRAEAYCRAGGVLEALGLDGQDPLVAASLELPLPWHQRLTKLQQLAAIREAERGAPPKPIQEAACPIP